MNLPAKARARLGVEITRSDEHRKILANLWKDKRVFNHYQHDAALILRTLKQE